MSKKRIKKIIFLLLVGFTCQVAIADNSILNKANEAFDKQDFKTALFLYEKILKKDTNNLNVLMWAAVAAQEVNNKNKQINLLRLLVKNDSKGLKGRKLLIQALHENNQTADCENEIKELISTWKLQVNEVKKKEVYFFRDQFTIGEYDIIALQYYKLEGKRAKRYHFVVEKEKSPKSSYAITLGSYPETTLMAREQGNIKEDERIWHVDGYTGTRHFTYAFFNTKLSYQKMKEIVIEIVKDDDIGKQSVSSSDFEGGVFP